MARQFKPKPSNSKRANRPNPRQDRNQRLFDDNVLDFPTGRPGKRNKYRQDTTRDDADQQTPNRAKPVQLLPRNIAQETYLDVLADEQNSIVFAMGPAGTGKTMLAVQFAISELQKGNIRKIVITRPAVANGEDLGALPGDIFAKMGPYIAPILDVFKEHYSVKTVVGMIESEIIEIVPMGFMRGRTLKSAVVIADECQNATPSQMKMLLTRIGEGSRMIVTGDLRQHDRGFEANGLKDFVERLERTSSSMIAVCRFSNNDVERHPVIEDILRIYGD